MQSTWTYSAPASTATAISRCKFAKSADRIEGDNLIITNSFLSLVAGARNRPSFHMLEQAGNLCAGQFQRPFVGADIAFRIREPSCLSCRGGSSLYVPRFLSLYNKLRKYPIVWRQVERKFSQSPSFSPRLAPDTMENANERTAAARGALFLYPAKPYLKYFTPFSNSG